ncbi:HAAS signaling domain-containing protein [Micromonospora sp. URMC 103]|uniref:HAAS signaling domain-containing protein n=1 Tax=Micromonospora sp. URMC 103 TaxID=3423406 RepID=UPI003F1D4E7F
MGGLPRRCRPRRRDGPTILIGAPMTPIDSLIDSYLNAIARAGAGLPPQRREDLLTDLREHITAARAELHPETEAGVRTVLDRLGEPESIIAEARQDEPPLSAALPAAIAHVPPNRSRTRLWVAVVAVLAVALAACVAGAFAFGAQRSAPAEKIASVISASRSAKCLPFVRGRGARSDLAAQRSVSRGAIVAV